MRKLLLIALIALALIAPAMATDYKIINATHMVGKMVWNADRTHADLDVHYENITHPVSVVVGQGHFVFRIFTSTFKDPGIWTPEEGIVYHTLGTPGMNYMGTTITYKVIEGNQSITKKLSVRDNCYFDIQHHQIYCGANVVGSPAFTAMMQAIKA